MINFLAPRGLRLNTVLGWGGLGVATLWEKHQKQADGAPGDERTFFVVKANLDPSSKSLNAEIIAQRWYADCMHMAQTVESPAPDLLVMEYERGGNLKDAMCKMSDPSAWLPYSDRALWLLMDCFFRMAVALEYPVRLQPGRVRGTPKMETEGTTSRTVIHFDIDPQNILVGERGDPRYGEHHRITPVLKLADFGLANKPSPEKLRDATWQWNHRMTGKQVFWLPEQFSEEWEHWIIPGVSPRAAVDAVLSDPEHVPGSSVVKVAGRYTWKSNMWQLALTMACIITKCQVNDPVLTPTRWVAPGMSADREAYTFGGAVLESDYSMVDEDLRILVAWCMMAHVDDRPEMSQIEGLISGKLAQPWNGAADSDQAITAWSKKVFGEPKDPDAPNEAVLAAFLGRTPTELAKAEIDRLNAMQRDKLARDAAIKELMRARKDAAQHRVEADARHIAAVRAAAEAANAVVRDTETRFQAIFGIANQLPTPAAREGFLQRSTQQLNTVRAEARNQHAAAVMQAAQERDNAYQVAAAIEQVAEQRAAAFDAVNPGPGPAGPGQGP
ncbi:hypothetical protein P8C59_008943 [Phyllachora maydis]|uniref:Protein kinase domain-containing protein n=1 Tax=Phyllachora maydis TaxID=1825666 RepID=A0AAD9MKJ3_9PEZI|nr:hypothetical protein P8C59_008943 [Phyllachora maydis]